MLFDYLTGCITVIMSAVVRPIAFNTLIVYFILFC